MCRRHAWTQFLERSAARIFLQLSSDQVLGPSHGGKEKIEESTIPGQSQQ